MGCLSIYKIPGKQQNSKGNHIKRKVRQIMKIQLPLSTILLTFSNKPLPNMFMKLHMVLGCLLCARHDVNYTINIKLLQEN